MEHSEATSEITFQNHHEDDATFMKKVIRTTVILSVITVIELGIGLIIYTMHKGPDPNAYLVLAFKGLVCILTLAKAFYIVSVFMHLGDEIRNMIMTIVVPLLLFVWFITAFIVDGNSYKNLRNRFDGDFRERTMPKKHAPVEHTPETETPKPGKQ
ncbi:MAG: cytochrome C oxidase subunit IV family protein [Chitinophagaceae bacterium]